MTPQRWIGLAIVVLPFAALIAANIYSDGWLIVLQKLGAVLLIVIGVLVWIFGLALLLSDDEPQERSKMPFRCWLLGHDWSRVGHAIYGGITEAGYQVCDRCGVRKPW